MDMEETKPSRRRRVTKIVLKTKLDFAIKEIEAAALNFEDLSIQYNSGIMDFYARKLADVAKYLKQ